MQYNFTNFTDPESRIMKAEDGFEQAYNVQIAVEAGYQLIVGQLVTQEVDDKPQLKPVLGAVREQSGQKPAEVVSDSGYGSDANRKHLEQKKIEGFVATDLWLNLCLDRSNRRVASASFSCVA